MSFEEQTFVVVGAARVNGIGLNFVKELLAVGVKKIAVFDIVDPSETIDELKVKFSDRNIVFRKVDVRNKSEIETAFKEVVKIFGYVDVLVNAAAIYDDFKIEDTLHINVLGVIYSTLVGINHMSVKNGGHGGMIVNVASMAGLDPFCKCPIYSSSKCAVVGLTRSFADKALASEFGIKFVVTCPGITMTEMLKNGKPQMFGSSATTEEFNNTISQYGIQTAEECAKSMLQALKESENGSAWILNKSKYTAVNFHQYYLLD